MADLSITVGDDVAFHYSLNHISGNPEQWAEGPISAALDGLLP